MPRNKNKSLTNPKVKHHDPRVRALYDIWAFADLIGYRGGEKNFAVIHKKLAGFVTSTQVAARCNLKHPKYVYNRRRHLRMPRGHLKSTVCSILYTLWRIYRNPDIRILYGTNVKELSEAFIRELRQYLEDEQLGSSVWNNRPHIKGRLIPVLQKSGRRKTKMDYDELDSDSSSDAEDKRIRWTGVALQVLRKAKLKEPTVFATSVGTKVTGQHYDLLILDDIVDFDNTKTLKSINTLAEWAQDLESIVDPMTENYYIGKYGAINFYEDLGDEVIILGTRYARGDYYEYLEKNKVDLECNIFRRNIYKDGKSRASGYIWDDKFNDVHIARLRKRLTPRRWASQYLDVVVSSDTILLDREKINYIDKTRNVSLEKLPLVQIIKSRSLQEGSAIETTSFKPIIVIDPAISQTATADSTAIVVGGMDEHMNVFIIDFRYGKHSVVKVASVIKELCEKYKTYVIYMENNGIGGSYAIALRRELSLLRAPIVIKDYRTGKGNKHGISGNKKLRIENTIQPILESGQLFLDNYVRTYPDIVDEFDLFPNISAKDDFLDAVTQLILIFKPVNPTRKSVYRKNNYNRKYGGVR